MDGCIVPPMAEAAATADPDTQPNIMLPRIVICASGPGIQPTNTLAQSIRRRAMPPRFMIDPAMKKNGMARSAKLSRPVAMRCAVTDRAGSGGMIASSAAMEASPVA